MPSIDEANSGFRLSIAIAVYNEESVLPELVEKVCSVLDQISGGPHELVFVNDGSSDKTPQLLEEATRRDPRIVAISLSRNFGHQAALSAALDHVSGDAVVLMDADLQDAPEIIPTFVGLFLEGNDVVYATRESRNESRLLRLCYKLFYRLQAGLSETHLPLDAGDFGLMSRRVVHEIRRMREQHRYLRGLRSWVGFRQVAVPVHRPQRHSGESKYGLLKLLKLAADGIFAFSLVPLRAATLVGLLAIVSAALYALYSAYAKFFLHQVPQGFTAIVFLLTFLSGVVLLFLGIVGEYVGRIYEEIKARPLYVIDRIIKTQSPQTHFRESRLTAHRQDS